MRTIDDGQTTTADERRTFGLRVSVSEAATCDSDHHAAERVVLAVHVAEDVRVAVAARHVREAQLRRPRVDAPHELLRQPRAAELEVDGAIVRARQRAVDDEAVVNGHQRVDGADR